MNYWTKLLGGVWTKREMKPIGEMPDWMARNLRIEK